MFVIHWVFAILDELAFFNKFEFFYESESPPQITRPHGQEIVNLLESAGLR